jgi:BirA family biotin operon repressor/biotin-[acetyl-CoA-carboxylase] ligase
VSPAILGRRVVHLDTVGSTMDVAAALAAAGEPEGTAVLAEAQTSGRGRADREWHSPHGAGILCSVVLRPRIEPRRLAVLPLIAGVAVAEAIEVEAGLSCHLKWPNDIWIDGRKIAGVLTTARSGPAGLDYVILGIGINVHNRAVDLPTGATSLLVATQRRFDRSTILVTLLDRLDEGYRAFVGAGGGANLAGWRARAALVGEPVVVDTGPERRAGTMLGIADHGGQLLERADGAVERIVAGELVRGPVPSPG